MKKWLIVVCAVLLIGSLMGSHVVYVDADVTDEEAVTFDGDYVTTLASWKQNGYVDNHDFQATITPLDFDDVTLDPLEETHGYSSTVYRWDDDTLLSWDITVPTEGLYQFAIDYFPLSNDYLDLELAIYVNDELPYQEAQQIILYKWWTQDASFTLDRYGNDFFASQHQVNEWLHQDFYDPMGLFAEPLCFYLHAGTNHIELERIKGELLVGDITVSGEATWQSYETYSHNAQLTTESVLIETEAEIPTSKNASNIQPAVSRAVNVTPFSVQQLKLNTVSGGTFNAQRETISYEISVPQAGYYHVSWKVMQSTLTNGVVYRTLRINGEVPFEEAFSLPIEYSTKWQTVTFGGDDPYLFYFNEGINTISLSVNLSPYQDAYYEINDLLDYVNALSLKIKKLTGNQLDEDRDWEITEYLPTVVDDLIDAAETLTAIQSSIAALSSTSKSSEMESLLKIAIRNLLFLAEEPNDIPKNIALLSTSSNSIASTLGNVISLILNSPLDVDKFYVHTDVTLPKANASFIVRFWISLKRFVLSFFDQRFTQESDGTELTVWINRNKQYVDLIQKMIDEDFTETTNIKVNASVMAAEGKLILANSAGTAPDVALGVSSWLPYDLGIRGAILDLTTYQDDPDFKTVLGYFPDQSLIPLMYNNGLYGLPDTENFYVLFYRRDILSSLDIDIPQTWDDVTKIMPILKRYGMNFYLPLSSGTSLKSFDSTLPFLFQYGSSVYQDNAMTVNLDNEASVSGLEMMTELYTIYSMDITVSSFYNDFRLGLSPIGVGDFGMYITLLNAAPDIQGLWDIALMPGVEKEGYIDRSAPGAQTANMIFAGSDQPDEAWAFLKWWASTETQTDFTSLLVSTFGKEYLWNSANTAAFQTLNIHENDITTIMAQWDYLKELPKVPGSYQVELELSNIWNSVVIDRENLRVLLNDGIIQMNREITKKMSEFGYTDKQGNVIKPYSMASTALIQTWKGDDSDD